MVGRTVKFPLEMKNGVQARNLADLQNNFDIEKIIGYFLDGRLKSWLEARYYEEEAEAIENIDKNASDLAKQLCEVFGVECDEISIDPEEIERRNTRITKLKQITSDEEIIKNVDSVAFNQEELADLYDLGKEKIYLCEGEFNIPKSKQSINYVFIGKPKVNWLSSQPTSLSDSSSIDKDENGKLKIDKNFVTEDDITEDLANFIGENDYVITNDYVVFKTNGTHFETSKEFKACDGFKRGENIIGYWNKNDNSVKLFVLKGCKDHDTFLGTVKNKIVLKKVHSKKVSVLLYDLDLRTSDVVCIDWNGNEKSFSTSDDFICYQDKMGNVKAFDIKTKKYKVVKAVACQTVLCLDDSTLWYVEKTRKNYATVTSLVEYDLINESKKDYTNKSIESIDDIIYVNKYIYLITSKLDETNYWKLNLGNNTFEKMLGAKRFSYCKKYKEKINSKYIIVLKEKSDFPVNVIDMSTGKRFVLCKNCGNTTRDTHLFRDDDVFYHGYPFYLVGHYFLYGEGKFMVHPDHYYRINIANRQKYEIFEKED